MKPALHQRWQALCAAALRATPERAPDAIVEALGYALWLCALGEEGALGAQRAALRKLAARTELTLAPATVRHDLDADDADDAAPQAAALRAIVHAARRVLQGDALTAIAREAKPTTLHPPAAVLVRLLEGRTDGLSAARYALHCAQCDACQRDLRALGVQGRDASSDDVPALRLAAASRAEVRSPAEGTRIAHKKSPAIEAVLFEDADARRLALYAASEAPVRLVAQGVTTEETLQGYWLGRIDRAIAQLHAELVVDGHSLRWKLPLTQSPPAPKKRVAKKKAVAKKRAPARKRPKTAAKRAAK